MSSRFLLDTHILLWWLSDDSALSANGRGLISDPRNEIFVSSISIWEIAIKGAMGKLDADVDEICASLASSGLKALSFSIACAAAIAQLPPIHRDPFDRALIAQARCNGLRLLTHDDAVSAYRVSIERV